MLHQEATVGVARNALLCSPVAPSEFRKVGHATTHKDPFGSLGHGRSLETVSQKLRSVKGGDVVWFSSTARARVRVCLRVSSNVA
jgi:deoxyinosine 3'endonuclease (endonuclease V)